MKKVILSTVLLLAMSSCGTLFTSSHQDITLKGDPGTKVYDNEKILGEIGEDGVNSFKLRKSLYSKKLLLKKDGYKDMFVKVESVFNPVSVINLTNVVAWAIDLGTGKCCKYDDSIVVFEMEKK